MENFATIVNRAIDASLERKFDDDDLCICIDCGLEEGVPYKEFKKGGKHFSHRLFPKSFFVSPNTPKGTE